jgi:glycosyltransferase involved in cell wall biosynthesis
MVLKLRLLLHWNLTLTKWFTNCCLSVTMEEVLGTDVLGGPTTSSQSKNPVRKMPVAEVQHKVLVERNSRPKSGPVNRRPLRICMVAYTFYETDSRVIRYAESLVQRGDQVDVFSLGKVGASASETLHGVNVRRLQGRVFDETGPFSYLWRVLLFLARALYQVSMHDLSQNYDLVHVHSVPDFLVFTALFPRLRGVPVILDIRDILPEFYASKFGVSEKSIGFRFLCLVERLCARFASHVIIASHTWRERLLSRSVNAGQCSLVLNVPDRSIFMQSKKEKDAKDCFLMLYHGTLNRHQGLDVAVRAFAKIKDLAPEAEFHIFGDGPSKAELRSLIEQLHLENRVVLHERRPLWEMPKIVETARLGIVPKRKDNFGNDAFSTKILEFMAMGVPVIVSDTNVDRYYFDDSMVRFFQAEDEDDLARCMLDLIQHPQKCAALIERATEFVSQNDWAVKKQEYLNLVDSLLPSANS